MLRRSLLSLLLLTTASTAAAAETRAVTAFAQGSKAAPVGGTIVIPPTKFTHRTLANGMKVYAVRDPSTANVTVQMWYDVGSKDDPQGRSGFAHLFEHIVSRVTRNMAPGQLNQIVEGAGGVRNAGTSDDFTYYHEVVPANQLETMLWAHAERMARLVLDESVFNAEKQAVKEELREKVLTPPYGRLSRFLMRENSYETHPYKRGTPGNMADLDAAGMEDVRAFHENFYRPDNATLIVLGNYDPAQLDHWVDKHFAAIERPKKPILRFMGKETPRLQPRSVTSYAPNVPLPAIAFTWQAPKLSHPDKPALNVLAAILSSGQSSRFYRSLVDGRQIAQSAVADYSSGEDAGYFSATVTLASGKEVEDAEAALAAEIARVRDQSVSPAEVAEARTEYLSSLLFEREEITGRAFFIGYGLVTTGDPLFFDKHLQRVGRVTAADVQRVARKYLTDQNQVSIRYLNESARPAGQVAAVAVAPLRMGLDFPPATRPLIQLAPDGERQAPPAPTAPRPFTTPKFAERTLSNGLRVVVAKSSDLPVSAVNVVFGGGASADPSDSVGAASMAASLADNGTRTLGAAELAARIEALGASIGGSAGYDSTTIFMSAPTVNLEAAGRLLASVIREPAFAAEEVERERKRSLDTLSVSMRQPSFLASQAAGRVLYGDAPYGRPTSGTPASLAALSRDDLARYQQTWWRPDNATVILAGSLSPEESFAVAERLFGDWRAPAGAAPASPVKRAGAPQPRRVVVVDLPGAGQAAVNVSVPAVSRTDPDFYPLTVGNAVLGSGSTGRLHLEVRVKRGLSYSAGSGLAARRDAGHLSASSLTKNETAAEAAAVIVSEVERLAKEPEAPEQLEKRKTSLSGVFAQSVQTVSSLGGVLANLAAQGLPMSTFSRHIASIQAVTPAQVASAVTEEIPASEASVVIVGDLKLFREDLQKRFPNAEIIPFAKFDAGSATLMED